MTASCSCPGSQRVPRPDEQSGFDVRWNRDGQASRGRQIPAVFDSANLWNTPAVNRVGPSTYFDFSQVQGSQPVTAADRANVLDALDALGARVRVTDISAMAKWLAAELRRAP